MRRKIPTSFLNHAASILADTAHGLSGSRIVEICNAWAVDYDVNTPHANYPFDAPNKRTALAENLAAFEPDMQYEILLDMCDRFDDDTPLKIDDLRTKIQTRFTNTEQPAPVAASPTPASTEPNSSPKTNLKVFLCHASDDKPAVLDLHRKLKRDGYEPWLDKIDLLPGQHWETEIPNAVRRCHIVIVCISNHSTTKEGYVQKEIKFALDVADEKPEGTIFVIPARLEDCNPPQRLSHLHRVDLFANDGYDRLLLALEERKRTI